ncbi:MAG: glucose-1-phosphate adenylyltransferase [Gemmataceae bacterium]|nr:glucose-1-phosphate adenylyltransferase [Gemmataceae bacterium]
MQDVLTLILAGGRGSRLEPLTRDRAKPGVPFGGHYRIIDFTLSNAINSGLRRVFVLTQYKARSLDRHIRLGWNFLSPELGEFVDLLHPQQWIGEHWYKGTADAIYQNIFACEEERPKLVLILAGDHIYKMDYAEMIQAHRATEADLTISCIPVPLTDSKQFGILSTDAAGRVKAFQEKPDTATPLDDEPDNCLGSMGIYVFNADKLYELLCEDATDPKSSHDFGKDIIPKMVAGEENVYAFRFRDRNLKTAPYWRDVGTLDAYYQANMDLVQVDPVLNLYDEKWPIRTVQPCLPPPKTVFAEDGPAGTARRGEALDSTVCHGCVISGGSVRRSVLSPNVRVNSYAVVEESIIGERVEIGRHARIRRAIIDKNVRIPPNASVGYDLEYDRQRGFRVTEGGIVVIPKAERSEVFLSPKK